MSHWVAPGQPPLAHCAQLQVGTGLLDDLFDRLTPKELLTRLVAPAAAAITTNEAKRIFTGDRTPFSAFHRIAVPAFTGAVGHAINDIKNRVLQQIPDEWGEAKPKRKRDEEGSGVGASRSVRPALRNPKVRRFIGDFHNELVSRGADDLAQRLSKIEIDHKRTQLKRNKQKPPSRR